MVLWRCVGAWCQGREHLYRRRLATGALVSRRLLLGVIILSSLPFVQVLDIWACMDRCAHWPFVIAVDYFLGTSHDWRLRCGAVDLYFTLFGLSRPSCLPLPELGLVLNLKEKKAVLNPTIIPEAIAGNQEAAVNPSSHAQLAGFQNPVRSTRHVEKVAIVLLFRAPKKRIVSLELEDFRATHSFLHHFKKCWLTLS